MKEQPNVYDDEFAGRGGSYRINPDAGRRELIEGSITLDPRAASSHELALPVTAIAPEKSIQKPGIPKLTSGSGVDNVSK